MCVALGVCTHCALNCLAELEASELFIGNRKQTLYEYVKRNPSWRNSEPLRLQAIEAIQSMKENVDLQIKLRWVVVAVRCVGAVCF